MEQQHRDQVRPGIEALGVLVGAVSSHLVADDVAGDEPQDLRQEGYICIGHG